MKQSLDMALLRYKSAHSSYGQLHKIKPEKVQARKGRGEEPETPAQAEKLVIDSWWLLREGSSALRQLTCAAVGDLRAIHTQEALVRCTGLLGSVIITKGMKSRQKWVGEFRRELERNR